MQTFYFPGAKNLFFPVNASVATRAGFLFADAVIKSPQTVLMIDMDAPLCVVSTEMKPVSYTHLDVYKRQLKECT